MNIRAVFFVRINKVDKFLTQIYWDKKREDSNKYNYYIKGHIITDIHKYKDL